MVVLGDEIAVGPGIAAAPSRSYGYDGASRVVDDGAGLGGFGWDPNTNRTSHHGVVSTYRADNTVATVDSATVDFDAAGRRVHPKTTATDCEYRYDALNRTVGVVAASGETCEDQAAYLHDPLGRQIIDVAGDDVDPADLVGGIANGWLELDDVTETHRVFDLLEADLLATLGWDTTSTGTDTDRSTCGVLLGVRAGPDRSFGCCE